MKRGQWPGGLGVLAPVLRCVSFWTLWVGFAAAVGATDEMPDIVKVYTHGEGYYALKQADGSLKGPGVDYLACTMERMNQPYELATASMARSFPMMNEQRLDIWFPTYGTGSPELEGRLVGPMGETAIHWFYLSDTSLVPGAENFKAQAKVTAFPGSRPERMLRDQGFRLVTGTDDENRLLLMLLEGQVDAILSADFRDTLKPGAAVLAERLAVQLHTRFPMMFELMPEFAARSPTFQARMQAAFDQCVVPAAD